MGGSGRRAFESNHRQSIVECCEVFADGIKYQHLRRIPRDHFRISVRDEGPGIAEGFRDQIFEKFTQADGSNTKQANGTGLGLSITKSIVEGHGGKLDYETEIGRGMTFFFDLPQAS